MDNKEEETYTLAHMEAYACIWDWVVSNDYEVSRLAFLEVAKTLAQNYKQACKQFGYDGLFDCEYVPWFMENRVEISQSAVAVRPGWCCPGLKTFDVNWSRTYVRSGVHNVVARDPHQAAEAVRAILGELEGTFRHLPEHDFIGALPRAENENQHD